MCKKLCIAIAILGAPTGLAKPQLERLIEIALERSYDSQIRNLDLKIAQSRDDDHLRAFLPTLDLSAGRSFNYNEVYNDGYEWDERSTNSLNLSMSVPIWSNGDRFNQYEQQRLQYQIALIQNDELKSSLARNIIEAYYNYQVLIQGESIKHTQKKNILWSLEKAQELIELGTKTIFDTQDIEIRLGNINRELLELEHSKSEALSRIKLMIDSKLDIKIDPIDLRKDKPWYEADFVKIKDEVKSQMNSGKKLKNRSLEILRKNYESSTIDYQQSKKRRWPSLSASAGYNMDFSPTVNSEIDGHGRNQTSSANIGLQLSWDLWDWFSIERDIERSYQGLRKNEIQLTKSESETIINLGNKLNQFDVNERSLKISADVLEKSQTQYDYAQEMYRLGRITVLELRVASVDLEEAHISFARTLKNRYLIMADIIRDSGGNLLPAP